MTRIGFKEAIEYLNDGYAIRLNTLDYTYRIVIDNDEGVADTTIGYLTLNTFLKLLNNNKVKLSRRPFGYEYYTLNQLMS